MDIPTQTECQYLVDIKEYLDSLEPMVDNLCRGKDTLHPNEDNLPEWTDPPLTPSLEARLEVDPSIHLERGVVAWTVEEGRRPQRFDLEAFLFLKAATAYKGLVRLNSNRTGKREGTGSFYPRLEFGRGSNHSIARIVARALPGQMVREDPTDYHNQLADRLKVVGGGVADEHPSKYILGRADAIRSALATYDQALKQGDDMVISRDEYEAMMWRLLELADARAAHRASQAQAAE